MNALLDVILIALQMYVWVLIIGAILSWLILFNVVNYRNPVVATIYDTVYKLTEPVLAPIRRRLPSLGGVDISPVVLILLIFLAQGLIQDYLRPLAF
jgi:YggT family protein